MMGLTESFNISVTVAIALYELRSRLDLMGGNDMWGLSPAEKAQLLDDWAVKSVRKGEDVLREVRMRLEDTG